MVVFTFMDLLGFLPYKSPGYMELEGGVLSFAYSAVPQIPLFEVKIGRKFCRRDFTDISCLLDHFPQFFQAAAVCFVWFFLTFTFSGGIKGPKPQRWASFI